MNRAENREGSLPRRTEREHERVAERTRRWNLTRQEPRQGKKGFLRDRRRGRMHEPRQTEREKERERAEWNKFDVIGRRQRRRKWKHEKEDDRDTGGDIRRDRTVEHGIMSLKRKVNGVKIQNEQQTYREDLEK